LAVAVVVVEENVEVAVVVGLTVINICLKAIFFKLSVAMKVTKEGLLAIMGVPEITPLVGFNCSPIGSSPPIVDQI
jgi:tetrahydromethanopterin S-methyltransferase subunit H